MVDQVVRLVVPAAALYLGLAVLGGWLWILLRATAPSAWLPPAPVLGIAVLGVSSWWWWVVSDGGLGQLLPVQLVASLVAAAVLARRHRDPLRAAFARGGGDVDRGRWAAPGAVGAAAVAFVVGTRALLARQPLSIGSFNNDSAFYAAIGGFLEQHGFTSAGPVVGTHMGDLARTDVPLTYAVFGFVGWLSDRTPNQLTLPTLLVLCVLLAQTTAGLLRHHTALPASVLVAVAALAQTPFLFTYSVANTFASHFVALLLNVVTIGALVDVRRSRTRNELAVAVALLAASVAGLLLAYPHMVFLLTPIVALVAFVSAGPGWVLRRRVVAVAATGGLLGAVLVGHRTVIAIQRMRRLEATPDFWPEPGVPPLHVVGFQRSWIDTLTLGSALGSVVLVAAALAAWRALDRERWTLPVPGLLAGGLGSYAALYFLGGGPRYQQWKWISDLQPILAVVLLAPVAGWVLARRPGRPSVAAICVVVTALGAYNLLSSEATRNQMYEGANWVTEDMADLGSNPALADIDELNVSLLPFWESMWVGVAVAPRTVTFTAATYYGPGSAPTAEWTLVRSTEIPPGVDPATVRPLTADYVLVPAGPPARESG